MTATPKTKENIKTPNAWPPLVHYLNDNDKAVCGADLVGILDPPADWPVCKKCERLIQNQFMETGKL